MNTPGPRIQVVHVSKRFRGVSGEEVPALHEASLEVLPGQIAVIMGPSGSGKTTLLRLIAGLEQPDSGTVTLDGQRPADLAPKDRNLGFAPQAPALFPHQNVIRNLELGLEFRQVQSEEKLRRVRCISEMLELSGCWKQYPHELSGGQKQRVSLGRALVLLPRTLLLDEPFANLDSALRARIRERLVAFQKEVGFTLVCVTHDPAEAEKMGGQVVNLRDGRLSA